MKLLCVKLTPFAVLPTRGSPQAAGWDLYAVQDAILWPGARVKVRTGLAIGLPSDTYGQILGRSGLSMRGVQVLPGVVDCDYRGEVQVMVQNTSRRFRRICAGDRVAQLLVCPVVQVCVEEAQTLSETQRGNGGFGSTG